MNKINYRTLMTVINPLHTQVTRPIRKTRSGATTPQHIYEFFAFRIINTGSRDIVWNEAIAVKTINKIKRHTYDIKAMLYPWNASSAECINISMSTRNNVFLVIRWPSESFSRLKSSYTPSRHFNSPSMITSVCAALVTNQIQGNKPCKRVSLQI